MELLDISVLYVEDADLIRVPASNIIKQKARKVAVASDGVEGLSEFERERFDIVITDISMPNMDGLEMARRIKELSPETIIIITTAFDDSKYLLSSIEIGIDQYLLKSSLKQQIPVALDKWYLQIIAERRKRAENDFVYHLSKSLIEDTDGIVMVVNLHGMIEFINKKFCEVTGYTEEELIGMSPRVLKSGKQSTEYYRHMYETVNNKVKWHGEFINKRKNGSLYRERAVVFPVTDQAGEIAYYVKSSFYTEEYHPAEKPSVQNVLREKELSGTFLGYVISDTVAADQEKNELKRWLESRGLHYSLTECSFRSF